MAAADVVSVSPSIWARTWLRTSGGNNADPTMAAGDDSGNALRTALRSDSCSGLVSSEGALPAALSIIASSHAPRPVR